MFVVRTCMQHAEREKRKRAGVKDAPAEWWLLFGLAATSYQLSLQAWKATRVATCCRARGFIRANDYPPSAPQTRF
ncbi:Hypothetical predicted protein [Cloeon dipterum]|uniref:Uncharacterized protein n=1 Tax=Cloeon dipterum TaxID=197152 RepID=A0A8S1BZE5_9INSE|nr:Hypothetical predicted protein [Cloeon dipterum]